VERHRVCHGVANPVRGGGGLTSGRSFAGCGWYDGDMRRLLVLVIAVSGCAYDAKGQGSGPGLGTGSSSEGGTTVEQGGSSSTTAAPEGSGSGGGSSTGSSSGTPPEPDTSTGEPPAPPTAHSCKEILDMDPSARTGAHSILRTSDDVVVEVWCDMTVDGGGWTLVGRSAPGPEQPFGWGLLRGMVGDEQEPYSLDAIDVALPFTEILVGQHMGFATLVEHAYAMAVPQGFLADYADAPYEYDDVRTVIGDCDPDPWPDMLRYGGYTDADWFHFRDVSQEMPYGLLSNGFWVFYENCHQGGDLNDQQGAVFVR
jgi:hypothetical protein